MGRLRHQSSGGGMCHQSAAGRGGGCIGSHCDVLRPRKPEGQRLLLFRVGGRVDAVLAPFAFICDGAREEVSQRRESKDVDAIHQKDLTAS